MTFLTQKYFNNFFRSNLMAYVWRGPFLCRWHMTPTNLHQKCLYASAAMFMLKNPYKYYKPLEIELLQTGESYESYVYNVYNRNIWGDDLIDAVIGNMWNISISIVTPVHKKPIALFHNKDVPDIVIVVNGSDYMSKDGSTHFSTTRCFDPGHKIVGSEYLNLTVAQDLTAKMTLIILDDRDKAKQVACRNFIKIDEERSLGLLRGLCENINNIG